MTNDAVIILSSYHWLIRVFGAAFALPGLVGVVCLQLGVGEFTVTRWMRALIIKHLGASATALVKARSL